MQFSTRFQWWFGIHLNTYGLHESFFFSIVTCRFSSFFSSSSMRLCVVCWLVYSLHGCKLFTVQCSVFIDMGKWFSNIFTFQWFHICFFVLILFAFSMAKSHLDSITHIIFTICWSIFDTCFEHRSYLGKNSLISITHITYVYEQILAKKFARWITICQTKFH